MRLMICQKLNLQILEMRIIKDKTVKFLDWECAIHIGEYEHNRALHSISLISVEDGIGVALATLNIDYTPMETPNTVFIKDYSENQGILELLVKEGVISKSKREIPLSQWAVAHECELLM